MFPRFLAWRWQWTLDGASAWLSKRHLADMDHSKAKEAVKRTDQDRCGVPECHSANLLIQAWSGASMTFVSSRGHSSMTRDLVLGSRLLLRNISNRNLG